VLSPRTFCAQVWPIGTPLRPGLPRHRRACLPLPAPPTPELRRHLPVPSRPCWGGQDPAWHRRRRARAGSRLVPHHRYQHCCNAMQRCRHHRLPNRHRHWWRWRPRSRLQRGLRLRLRLRWTGRLPAVPSWRGRIASARRASSHGHPLGPALAWPAEIITIVSQRRHQPLHPACGFWCAGVGGGQGEEEEGREERRRMWLPAVDVVCERLRVAVWPWCNKRWIHPAPGIARGAIRGGSAPPCPCTTSCIGRRGSGVPLPFRHDVLVSF